MGRRLDWACAHRSLHGATCSCLGKVRGKCWTLCLGEMSVSVCFTDAGFLRKWKARYLTQKWPGAHRPHSLSPYYYLWLYFYNVHALLAFNIDLTSKAKCCHCRIRHSWSSPLRCLRTPSISRHSLLCRWLRHSPVRMYSGYGLKLINYSLQKVRNDHSMVRID